MMHFIQCSHQHVSAGIPAIYRVILLQDYKTYECGQLRHRHSVTTKIIISVKIMQYKQRLQMDSYYNLGS